VQTYATCDPSFSYKPTHNPRRVLTKPSKPGTANDGHDNEEGDYILYVNDVLGSQEGQQFSEFFFGIQLPKKESYNKRLFL
jgi:hypothetical protein